MEEAEFLSDRIGVINEGQLRAVGTSSYLKNQFCNWIIVELIISHSPESIIDSFTKDIGGEVIYSISELVKIKVMSEIRIYNKILAFLEKQSKTQLKTWSIKKGNLEDVFNHIQKSYCAN